MPMKQTFWKSNGTLSCPAFVLAPRGMEIVEFGKSKIKIPFVLHYYENLKYPNTRQKGRRRPMLAILYAGTVPSHILPAPSWRMNSKRKTNLGEMEMW